MYLCSRLLPAGSLGTCVSLLAEQGNIQKCEHMPTHTDYDQSQPVCDGLFTIVALGRCMPVFVSAESRQAAFDVAP